MKRKLMLFLSFLIIGIGFVSAQNSKITGVVISEDDGQPIVGASVSIKGTKLGSVTDLDGKFTISGIPANAKTIVASFIGMNSKEVPIAGHMRIILQSNTQAIDEVIVTGYGTFKKASFTGSAANLTPDKLQNVPTLSVEDKLAGNIPGVQISSYSGAPGATSYIQIRGMGSMNAGNDPLFVIDGTPMQSGNVNGFSSPTTGYNQSGTNLLSTLNSNDIESITVIKDAAAASLYGSRAANGVIVITTKSGKSGKTQFNLRSDLGFSNMAINYRPTLSGDDRRTLIDRKSVV